MVRCNLRNYYPDLGIKWDLMWLSELDGRGRLVDSCLYSTHLCRYSHSQYCFGSWVSLCTWKYLACKRFSKLAVFKDIFFMIQNDMFNMNFVSNLVFCWIRALMPEFPCDLLTVKGCWVTSYSSFPLFFLCSISEMGVMNIRIS